jgi:heptosyltransferase-2
MPKTHLVDRFFKAIPELEVKNDGGGLEYFILPKEETKREDIPVSHQAGYIVAAIGAEYNTRKWPLHKWKQFVANMDHPVILIGSKEDIPWGKEIASVDPVKIYNACGKFNINESADLVKKSKLVIAHDNDWMQIAAAYQRPVISIWGNTAPSFGTTPYYGNSTRKEFASAGENARERSQTLQINKLGCRPCSVKGYHQCPRGHFKCMEKISTEDLVVSVKKML